MWDTLARPKGVDPIAGYPAVAATAEGRAWVFVSSVFEELGTSTLTAVEWRGRSWSAAHNFAGSPTFGTAIASGPDDVWGFGTTGSRWVTGTVAAQPKRVEVLHWSKGAWRNVALPKISVPKGEQMLPGLITAATAASVWATVEVGPRVGAARIATVLLHWNGRTWTTVPVPKGVSIYGLASDGHGVSGWPRTR